MKSKNKNVKETTNSRNFQIDELSEIQLKKFSENYQLVCLVINGVSIKQAIERIGSELNPRSVRRLIRRYRKQGSYGLIDKRWLRQTENTVLNDEVKKIILHYYFKYEAAGQRLIWRAVCDACKDLKYREPSEASIRKFIDSISEPLKMLRRGKMGEKKWKREAAPVIRYENTNYGNERWQADHAPLPIWVKKKINDEWTPSECYITAIMDAHTRSIAGFIISTKYPDSWSISLAFLNAIKPKKNKKWNNKGLPFVFQTDQGKDFMSKAVASTLAKLKIIFDPDPPYYPNRKGKVERFFLTLDTGCLRILPGHKEAVGKTFGAAIKRVHEFFTLRQLIREIERFIVEEYHERINSTTGKKPGHHWTKTARLRMADEDDLNLLILKDDIERTVRNTGIQFTYNGYKRYFWSPELVDFFQVKVKIAYNPEDLESVIVYDAASGKRICEAFDLNRENPKYTIEDIRTTRNQYRRGLKARIKDYLEEIELHDRRILREKEDEEMFDELLAGEHTDANEKKVIELNEPSEEDELLRMIEDYDKTLRGE